VDGDHRRRPAAGRGAEPLAGFNGDDEVPVRFTIGPVDFPDTAADQKATGARFLNDLRGYSGTSRTNVEHYCLDCSFRPWRDATDRVTARVTITRARGGRTVETVRPRSGGTFVTRTQLATGDRAQITITDAWGDTTARPALVKG
jgi:hypothetical protein